MHLSPTPLKSVTSILAYEASVGLKVKSIPKTATAASLLAQLTQQDGESFHMKTNFEMLKKQFSEQQKRIRRSQVDLRVQLEQRDYI